MPAKSRPGRGWSRGNGGAKDYSGPPLVSFEKRIADGLGLKLGDPVTVNVLGRNITATIANMRLVDWESLGINFVMVFSPNAFAGAPHSNLATLTYPGGGTPSQEAATIRAVAESFPMVTAVRVKEALEAIGSIVSNLVLAIRGASAVTLVAAALVLGGALAAGHRHRVYDAVILKTLGATRRHLISAYGIEYLLIGVGHGPLRSHRRLARSLVDRRAAHAPAVYLVALAGDGGGWRRGHGYRHPRAGRHLRGAGPETGPGAQKSLVFATFRRVSLGRAAFGL